MMVPAGTGPQYWTVVTFDCANSMPLTALHWQLHASAKGHLYGHLIGRVGCSIVALSLFSRTIFIVGTVLQCLFFSYSSAAHVARVGEPVQLLYEIDIIFIETNTICCNSFADLLR